MGETTRGLCQHVIPVYPVWERLVLSRVRAQIRLAWAAGPTDSSGRNSPNTTGPPCRGRIDVASLLVEGGPRDPRVNRSATVASFSDESRERCLPGGASRTRLPVVISHAQCQVVSR